MQKAEGSKQKTACLSSCLPPSAYCLLVFAYCLLVVLCSFFVVRAVIEAIKVHYLVASRSIASDSIKAILQVKHSRAGHRHRVESFVTRHPGPHGQSRRAQEEPGIGDVVVRVKAYQHAGLLQRRSRLKRKIYGLELTARTIYHDYGSGNFRGRNFICNLPSFRYVVQDKAKSELFGKSQSRQNVVVTVGVKMDDTLAFHRFDQSIECQVASGQLCDVAFGASNFLGVFLSFDKLFTYQRSRFCAGAGKRTRRAWAKRVGAAGHLQAAGDLTLRVFDEQVINYFAASEFQIKSLPARQVA